MRMLYRQKRSPSAWISSLRTKAAEGNMSKLSRLRAGRDHERLTA